MAIIDIDEATAKELNTNYGVKAMVYGTDVADPEQVDQMIEAVLNEFGTIHIAHNNAGISTPEKAEEISYKTFRKVIDINLIGVFLTSQAAGKVMIQRSADNCNL